MMTAFTLVVTLGLAFVVPTTPCLEGHFDAVPRTSCVSNQVNLHSYSVNAMNDTVASLEAAVTPIRVVNFCVELPTSTLMRVGPHNGRVAGNNTSSATSFPSFFKFDTATLSQRLEMKCSVQQNTDKAIRNWRSILSPVWGHQYHDSIITSSVEVPSPCNGGNIHLVATADTDFVPVLISVVQRTVQHSGGDPRPEVATIRQFEDFECSLIEAANSGNDDDDDDNSGGPATREPKPPLWCAAAETCECDSQPRNAFDFREVTHEQQQYTRRLLSARQSALPKRDGLSAYTADVREAAHGLHEHFGFTAFLSEESTVAGSDAIKMILDPVIHGVMNPVIQIVVGEVPDRFMEVMGDQLREIQEQNVPPNVARMLASTLIPSVTNALVDSVTARLSQSLTESLTVDLGTSLEYSVSKSLLPELRRALVDTFTAAIPARLRRSLPGLISDPLLYSMVSTLTKSVTHSLVPTLTSVLTSQRHQSMACADCYYHQSHCNLCKFSASNQYYDNYYSTYYADFYTNYYGQYYDKAVETLIRTKAAASEKAQKDYAAEIKSKHGH